MELRTTVLPAPYKITCNITTTALGVGTYIPMTGKTGYVMRVDAYVTSASGGATTEITLVNVYSANVDGPDLLGGAGMDKDFSTQYTSVDISPSSPALVVGDDLRVRIADGGNGQTFVVVLYIDPNVEN